MRVCMCVIVCVYVLYISEKYDVFSVDLIAKFMAPQDSIKFTA